MSKRARPLAAGQRTLPGASPPVAVAVEAPEDRNTKAAKGMLTHGRQAEIIRHENGIMNLVHNWDNRNIVPMKTITTMKYSQRDLITESMIPILHVLKTSKDHLATVKGALIRCFSSATYEPVRCHQLNGPEIEKLMSENIGDMAACELKVKVNDSKLGSINKYVGMLRTFVTEEMDVKIRCVRTLLRMHTRTCLTCVHCGWQMCCPYR